MDYYNFDSENEKFPLYIKFSLNNNIIEILKSHFLTPDQEYVDSQIFNTQIEQNELNNDVRISQKISINDTESFKLINDIVIPEINK